MRIGCRECGWASTCGPLDQEQKLRSIGLLRRDKAPDELFVAELFRQNLGRFNCPECQAALQILAEVESHEDDWDDWQAAVLCEVCRKPIPPERLEVVPGTRRCVNCQQQAEDGTLPEEPDFCSRCGSLLELRVSRASGTTQYRLFCTGSPPCRS